MMKPFWLLGVLLSVTGWALAAPMVLYVAPGGDDTWSGVLQEANAEKSDGPVATLARARDIVRERNTGQGAMVYVRGGNYFLKEPLRLEKADSGTRENPIVWQAYPGESVRLIGAVNLSGFTPYKDSIVKTDVSALNLPKSACRQLFVNGSRQILARWPNKGEGDIPGGAWAFIGASVESDKNQSFIFAGDRPAGWTQKEGIEVSIWPNYNWWQTVASVASIDPATHAVHLSEKLPYTIEPGRRYYFQNIFEELDAPGEWYLDEAGKALYLFPTSPVENAEIFFPICDNLLRIEGAAHLAWLGFTMEASISDAVVVKDCRAVMIGRCTVRNTGAYGISVRGGARCKVAGCDIDDTGRGGIILDGGDRKTLKPAAHVAVNNHIHDVAVIYQTYETGVNVSGVGNRVANNLIHDLPHIGILLTGNDHMIEYNEIHHVCLQGSDNGGFYMGRDWTQRGNTIRCNKFHDIYGFGLAKLGPGEDGKYHYESPHQAWGVYLDDCTSGVKVTGNLFYRVPLCGVMIGGGRDNIVDNNVFYDCIPALHIDARWDDYCWDVMKERLEAMNYTQPPYSERYPELLKMGEDPRRPANNAFTANIVCYSRDDYRGLDSTRPGDKQAVVYDLVPFDAAGTKIDHNIIYHPQGEVQVYCKDYTTKEGGLIGWKEWQEKGFDKNSLLGDPILVDPKKDDFSLGKLPPTEEKRYGTPSPALDQGFVFIPDARIGLYQDEFRASWPPPPQEIQDDSTHREWLVTP